MNETMNETIDHKARKKLKEFVYLNLHVIMIDWITNWWKIDEFINIIITINNELINIFIQSNFPVMFVFIERFLRLFSSF